MSMTIAQTFLARDKKERALVYKPPVKGQDLNVLADKRFEDICDAEVWRKIFLDDGSAYTLRVPTSSQRFIELVDYENEDYREVYFNDDSYLTMAGGMILTDEEKGEIKQTDALTNAMVKSANLKNDSRIADYHVNFLSLNLTDSEIEECQERAKKILNKGV
jgi:hypothetical protein